MADDRWQSIRDRLFSQTKFGIELGLQPIRRAFEAEGHPERHAPAILIAGTNGKGGTAAFLSSLLQAHGLRVGTYTSPHLLDLPERFRVDGRPLEPETVFRTAGRLLEAYGEPSETGPHLSFFELTTLAAGLLFEAADLDIAVWEVGLGGRLDAVNAVEPALSVITNVGLDHTEYLGETISVIAAEKAAILREGRPAVIGRQRHAEVYEIVAERGAEPLRIWGRDFDLTPEETGVELEDRHVQGLEPVGSCRTRRENMAAAIQAAAVYLDEDFRADAAREAVRRTRWPGRMDLHTVPADRFGTRFDVPVLFDGAHNPEAVSRFFDDLEALGVDPGAFLVSGLADKDLGAMFGALADRETLDAPVFPSVLDSERAAPADALLDALPDEPAIRPTDTRTALAAACRHVARSACGPDEVRPVVVFGSLYLVGEGFRALGRSVADLRTWADSGPASPPR